MAELDRDTLFKKLRSKPENKVRLPLQWGMIRVLLLFDPGFCKEASILRSLASTARHGILHGPLCPTEPTFASHAPGFTDRSAFMSASSGG